MPHVPIGFACSCNLRRNLNVYEQADARWYQDGLQFSCTQCSHCCTGDPGFVWLSEEECDALADRLGLEPLAFRRRYTRVVHRKGQASFAGGTGES